MAQVSRSTFATSLSTKINDNTAGEISAQDVRDIFTDLEDSATWFDEVPVQSVNGATGTVVLDADDIDDTSTTHKFATAAELSKLAGIETGADVTDAANVETAIEAITYTNVTPATGDKYLVIDATDGGLKAVLNENLPTGGGGLANVVEDTTPQLGGNLDTQGNQITGGLVMPERADHAFTPSAGVGEVWIKNDATQKLMFTDDAGADREVLTNTSGESLAEKTTPTGADDLLGFDNAASGAAKTFPASHFTSEVICIAVSDETTALTTGTAKATFRMPWAMTLTAVRASVTTAPVGSVLTVDINEGGTTILGTKLTIDASEKTSTTAATAAVISDTALADDAEITIDIDTVGSGTAGAGLKVYLIGYR